MGKSHQLWDTQSISQTTAVKALVLGGAVVVCVMGGQMIILTMVFGCRAFVFTLFSFTLLS